MPFLFVKKNTVPLEAWGQKQKQQSIMKRRLLFFALLLAALPLRSLAYTFSAVAPSGQTLYYNIVNGNAHVTSQNSSYPSYYSNYPTGNLTIPESVVYNGITYAVTSIKYYAFGNCSGLTSIVIPNSVTSIGHNAFYGCSGLASITVASGNTVYDSRNNCNAIIETATNTLIVGFKNTVIPNSVTSIGDEAFAGCNGLTSIVIPNSVTSIGSSVFYGCSPTPSPASVKEPSLIAAT